MSDPESSSSYFGLDDPQWLCMVTLFIASLVTLVLYFVQYFHLRATGLEKTGAEDNAAEEEAASLLGWALSLNSWKSQWRGAWCKALNAKSRESSGSPIILTFYEDDVEASELMVSKVSRFKRSAPNKASCCLVVGEKFQFSLGVSATTSCPVDPCKYTVCISPLEMQLELQLQEAEDQVKVSWGICHLETEMVQVTPNLIQDNVSTSCVATIKEQLKQALCVTRPSVILRCKPSQASDVKETCNKVFSPPKPPRAHDWKLLVKNIRVILSQQDDAAGSINPICVLQLNDPPQKFNTSVLKNTANPAWDQPFVFELNGRSKELIILLVNDGQPQEEKLLGQVSVPFDLVRKQPKGQQTFSLITKDVVTGSLTTDFTYLDPSEVRSWQPPTPASTKKVEMDRTVMPCGTVVTTVTAVKSKPGRMLHPGLSIDSSQKAMAHKPKLSERRVSEQTSMLGGTVSKALSSSDTELLMLNGTDPVAEAAIKQLHQSAKQKLRSPVKKSTIIISGITKTPLSQDDELALMAGYAAAMDASLSDESSSQDMTTAIVSGTSTPLEGSEHQQGPSGLGCPPDTWESHTGEDLNHTSLSMCVSEVSCKKRRGSFLQKSAKLFFRRRHQRKDPSMSQSHNDLVYLDSPTTVERASKTATLSRMLSRKSKSKANGSASTGHPPA
ncbi:C2 domain-containing protein 2 isoform X2 [Corythoichthys intestinalis]|uniref:C2 domain-containing protein 2 isoform X2 n=1 Tax=Corythoichthys intestinalis TaxID=161448 RepID=UPI0025A62F26|nr:C2 domain-containing protein 2 isoform X2 [Corythoichthys intestinalis]XP_061800947.1 C2 domain-containing protein 2-like [Nerophis lumbriciformis]